MCICEIGLRLLSCHPTTCRFLPPTPILETLSHHIPQQSIHGGRISGDKHKFCEFLLLVLLGLTARWCPRHNLTSWFHLVLSAAILCKYLSSTSAPGRLSNFLSFFYFCHQFYQRELALAACHLSSSCIRNQRSSTFSG